MTPASGKDIRLNVNQRNALLMLCQREGPAWNDIRRAIEKAEDDSATLRRHRETYLPETVKQALASARRLRGQVHRAWLAVQKSGPLLKALRLTHGELCRIERRLRKRALPLARKGTP